MKVLPPTSLDRQDLEESQPPETKIDIHPARIELCHARDVHGETCSKCWTPPLPRQLCAAHRRHVNQYAPCHFLKLPTELRQEIFKYLMPTRPIDSLTIYRCIEPDVPSGLGALSSSLRTVFPSPLLCSYLGFNKEIYEEVKETFYAVSTFTIDICRDGVMLCGRRILEPTSPSGFGYTYDTRQRNEKFLRSFVWSAVRNYSVNISIERKVNMPGYMISGWDEEIELYDIRDFVAVVVSGVLAKARRLCRLEVRLTVKNFHQSPQCLLPITKVLIGPLERLRCVQKPRLVGVFIDDVSSGAYRHRHRACNDIINRCATPPLPELLPILGPGLPAFQALATDWERCLATKASSSILPKSPMTKLFLEFRALYNKLAAIMPLGSYGRPDCFLHRARVAREHEDIEKFRAVAAELLQHWHHRLRLQELEKAKVNPLLRRMNAADTYPR